jgi:hypothetical protein
MLKRTTFAARLSALAAAALALAPNPARAVTHSDTGWVQLRLAASDSASTTIADREFGIGYAAQFAIEGYNWDVAPNTISVSCVSYLVDMGAITITIQASECPTLPGTQLSHSVASTSATFAGMPATRKTTTIEWDVQDAGATARADGSFRVPVTLFDRDLDLFKLTATGVGNTGAADTLTAAVHVLGAKIKEQTVSLPASTTIVDKEGTIAEVNEVYVVWGIPISVGATLSGQLQVDAGASFAAARRTLTGTVTPAASVDATFSAGIGAGSDAISAEAGVEGNLTIVDASLPVSLSAAIGPGGITVTESARLTMTGLDGDVSLYAEACFLGGCLDTDLELFSWTGLTYVDATIFSASQALDY